MWLPFTSLRFSSPSCHRCYWVPSLLALLLPRTFLSWWAVLPLQSRLGYQISPSWGTAHRKWLTEARVSQPRPPPPLPLVGQSDTFHTSDLPTGSGWGQTFPETIFLPSFSLHPVLLFMLPYRFFLWMPSQEVTGTRSPISESDSKKPI